MDNIYEVWAVARWGDLHYGHNFYWPWWPRVATGLTGIGTRWAASSHWRREEAGNRTLLLCCVRFFSTARHGRGKGRGGLSKEAAMADDRTGMDSRTVAVWRAGGKLTRKY